MVLFMLALVLLVLLLLSPLIASVVLFARKHVKAATIVLGIYVALTGVFLIHAQFNRRSTSGHILRWLKGEYGIYQQVNDLAEDVKKSVDASELQRWAVAVLQEAQPTNSWAEIPRENV